MATTKIRSRRGHSPLVVAALVVCLLVTVQGQPADHGSHGKPECTTPAVTILKFTEIGSHNWTAPDCVNSIEILVVGGGGGGGFAGGGGGAGGLIYKPSYPVTPGRIYSIYVGQGGAGGVSFASGTRGNGTTFGDNLVAAGGGGGTYQRDTSILTSITSLFTSLPIAKNGGSGGGAGNGDSPGVGTAKQGSKGGASSDTFGGGGGGAGGDGADASAESGGAGGPGVSYKITGSWVCYAGGGGGGTSKRGSIGTRQAPGGCPGGGLGGADGLLPTPGAPNTGSGGGGGDDPNYFYPGADGGSGIVVLRYGSD